MWELHTSINCWPVSCCIQSHIVGPVIICSQGDKALTLGLYAYCISYAAVGFCFSFLFLLSPSLPSTSQERADLSHQWILTLPSPTPRQRFFGCLGTCSVDQAGLDLRNLPASACRVLGLKASQVSACCMCWGFWFTSFFSPVSFQHSENSNFIFFTAKICIPVDMPIWSSGKSNCKTQVRLWTAQHKEHICITVLPQCSAPSMEDEMERV